MNGVGHRAKPNLIRFSYLLPPASFAYCDLHTDFISKENGVINTVCIHVD